jgi:hypothetical protein
MVSFWHDFCTIKSLKGMAMHVQMCTSFKDKIFWRLEVNFPFILWKFTYHLYKGSVKNMKNEG